jgi:hypothetical protein
MWISIVLGLILAVAFFIIWNLDRQVRVLEAELLKSAEMEDSVVSVYEFFLKVFTEALNQMNRVDKNGAYSSDDEVGFAFRVVMESIEQVKLQIEKMKVTDSVDDEA